AYQQSFRCCTGPSAEEDEESEAADGGSLANDAGVDAGSAPHAPSIFDDGGIDDDDAVAIGRARARGCSVGRSFGQRDEAWLFVATAIAILFRRRGTATRTS